MSFGNWLKTKGLKLNFLCEKCMKKLINEFFRERCFLCEKDEICEKCNANLEQGTFDSLIAELEPTIYIAHQLWNVRRNKFRAPVKLIATRRFSEITEEQKARNLKKCSPSEGSYWVHVENDDGKGEWKWKHLSYWESVNDDVNLKGYNHCGPARISDNYECLVKGILGYKGRDFPKRIPYFVHWRIVGHCDECGDWCVHDERQDEVVCLGCGLTGRYHIPKPKIDLSRVIPVFRIYSTADLVRGTKNRLGPYAAGRYVIQKDWSYAQNYISTARQMQRALEKELKLEPEYSTFVRAGDRYWVPRCDYEDMSDPGIRRAINEHPVEIHAAIEKLIRYTGTSIEADVRRYFTEKEIELLIKYKILRTIENVCYYEIPGFSHSITYKKR